MTSNFPPQKRLTLERKSPVVSAETLAEWTWTTVSKRTWVLRLKDVHQRCAQAHQRVSLALHTDPPGHQRPRLHRLQEDLPGPVPRQISYKSTCECLRRHTRLLLVLRNMVGTVTALVTIM